MTGPLLELVARPASETYGELFRSGPHWLFELTIEAVTAPLAFVLGWVWRNGILRHLHHDLDALTADAARECLPPPPRDIVDMAPNDAVVEGLVRRVEALEGELRRARAETSRPPGPAS